MSDIFEITLLSLKVSLIATLISLLIGLPCGTWLALGNFRGRSVLLSVVNTGMALPPVVVGLVVAMTLWRSGPLGDLKLIYTPAAIIVAQTVIATPVVMGLTAACLSIIGSAPSPTTPWAWCFTNANDLDAVARSPSAAACCAHGRLWFGHL